jgi:hypothetical protein
MDDLFGPESAPLSPPPNDPQPRPPDVGGPPAAEAKGESPLLADRSALPAGVRTVPHRCPPRGVNDDFRDLGRALHRLSRLLYSHNPFYCISAFLVLWGLGRYMQGPTPRPELLMSGLAGYALLLAAVGWLLIRAGQLWEDIRTILLLIVVIFLAISMSFDEVLSANLALGRMYYLVGLAFAVVLSELVLRGVRLRLPMLYRIPYYATLAMFFLYPLLLGPWQDQENDPHIRWLLAGFSPLAGLVTLSLLPAVRRGPDYVRDNGSPWQWPWYPWPLFVLLAVGVGLRCYALCVSFHPSRGPATMFEPYFLVPWLLAVNILLLEIGISRRRAALVRWMMAAPLGLLWLSTWTVAVPKAIGLRPMLLETIGCTPLFITLVAAALFYAVTLLRRVPNAFGWLTASLALLVVVGPTTTDIDGPFSPRAWPLVLLAALQLGAAVRQGNGAHAMLAAICAIAAACVLWRQPFAMHWGGALPAHLLLLAMLLIGAVLKDRAAQFLQRAAIVAILLSCLFAMSGQAERWSHAPPALLAIYPGLMLLMAAAYGTLVHNRWYWAASLVILLGWVAAFGGHGYRSMRTKVAGLDQIALGLACLFIGLLVSLWKIGVPQIWLQRWLKPPWAPAVPIKDVPKS